MYYIVDTYSPYERNKDVKYVFEYNNLLWCVREINEFKWGQPQFEELPLDDSFIEYKIYENLEDAIKYCKTIKGVYV